MRVALALQVWLGLTIIIFILVYIYIISPFYTLSDLLTIKDLNRVLNGTWDARSKWYKVGLGLGIPAATLDTIELNKQKGEDCYTEMLKQWLEESNRTWSALTDVLRSPSVGMDALADKLCTSQ